MNHFFESIDGNTVNILDFYTYCVNRAPKDTKSKFAEVGAWKGRSAAYMIVEIANSEKPIDFLIVDMWEKAEFLRQLPAFAYEPATYAEFIENMRPAHHLPFWSTLREESTFVAKLQKPHSFDMVFIDADHSYDACKADIQAWLPKVKRGGILAGHDYSAEYDGVVRAVDETLGPVKTSGIVWIYEVPV